MPSRHAARRSDERWCDVCQNAFKADRGLKIHEASAPHRAKQLAADTNEPQPQRDDTITANAQPDQSHRHLTAAQPGPDQSFAEEPQEPELGPVFEEAIQPHGSIPVDLREGQIYQHNQTPSPWPTCVAVMMPLLTNLSGADRELFIKNLVHPDFPEHLKAMPWKSADQIHEFRDEHQVS